MGVASNFAVIGGGWRAEFFVRAALGSSGTVSCQGVTSRRPGRREELANRYGIATFQSVDEVLDRDLGFIVLAVAREETARLLEDICAKTPVCVLVETPPGLEVAELRQVWELSRSGARIQVAEQYRWQPNHAARLAVLNEGVIGERHQAWVSVAHGYHGVSLLWEYLGGPEDEWRELTVTARKLASPVVAGPGRDGAPAGWGYRASERVVAVITGGTKYGIYDFDGEQYFSEIRGQHVAVRGDRGELRDDRFTYLEEGAADRAREDWLVRIEGGRYGDLGAPGLQEVRFQGRPVYRKPTYIGRLSDEETAIAECLRRMAVYVAQGDEFYSVERACRDRYLELTMTASADNLQTVHTALDNWKVTGRAG